MNMLDKLRQIMNNLNPPSDQVSSNSGDSSYVVEDGPCGSTSAITCQAQPKVSSVQPPFPPLLNSPPSLHLSSGSLGNSTIDELSMLSESIMKVDSNCSSANSHYQPNLGNLMDGRNASTRSVPYDPTESSQGQCSFLPSPDLSLAEHLSSMWHSHEGLKPAFFDDADDSLPEDPLLWPFLIDDDALVAGKMEHLLMEPSMASSLCDKHGHDGSSLSDTATLDESVGNQPQQNGTSLMDTYNVDPSSFNLGLDTDHWLQFLQREEQG